MRIFINYRRQDTGPYAHLLRARLAAQFGAGDVFLDVVDLKPGMQWLEQIRARGGDAAILLALIGPEWLAALRERAQVSLNEDSVDMVKHEIELALGRGSGVQVVPVVVEDAVMPGPEDLPRSLRPLAFLQAAQLRHSELERDVDALVKRLEFIGQSHTQAPPQPPVEPPRAGATAAPRADGREAPRPDTSPAPTTSQPHAGHYRSVVKYMLSTRSIVPVLGPEINAGGPDPYAGRRLAAGIAESFGVAVEPVELARVAQHVLVTAGSPDLHDAMRRLLAGDSAPTAIHRFLANLPRRLQEAGLGRRFQMIVTTNYDTALERAFDDENEPYDLVVFMASGPDLGRFVHFPFDRDPEVITVPNRYGKLPIEDDGELQRTLIVKIHGAVDGTAGEYRWRENYVVTEDQYIEYLSHSSVERLVPVQILDKLTSGHCLFVGYPLAEWNLRVFLRRIWQGGRIASHSWAVEGNPGAAEGDFWRQFSVELLAQPLDDYIVGLDVHLQARLTGG